MDDFLDDFDEGDFMDGDSFDDFFDENFESEDCFEDDQEVPDEPDGAELQEDGFSAREAFFFGAAIGLGYELGLEESERQRLEKKIQDDKSRK